MSKKSAANENRKPRSEAQIAASRANGSQSLGPVTAAGKCKISSNRMVHGFRGSSISLRYEDREAYDAHLDAYRARYTPIDKVEEDLVGLLASQMWQIMRNNSIEVALFDIEIGGIDAQIHGNFETMDQYGRLALAFKKSAGDNALELLRRYKSTAERAYHRALQALEQIQKDRKSKPDASQPDPLKNLSAVQTQATAPPPVHEAEAEREEEEEEEEEDASPVQPLNRPFLIPPAATAESLPGEDQPL